MSKEYEKELWQEVEELEAKIKEEEAKEPRDQDEINHLHRLYAMALEGWQREWEFNNYMRDDLGGLFWKSSTTK
jgi:hypothetical protein